MISPGTDIETAWNAPYPALHEELGALKQVGMTNIEVIRAATETAARASGQEKEMGTVTPGKLANLVFVSADPLADIGALHKVVFTVKRGREYQRSDYPAITADEYREP